jgi:hypothetical protein
VTSSRRSRINASSGKIFGPSGECLDETARFQLQTVASQVVEFAAMRKASSTSVAVMLGLAD